MDTEREIQTDFEDGVKDMRITFHIGKYRIAIIIDERYLFSSAVIYRDLPGRIRN